MAMGLGLVFWMFLLFSPLAWVGQAKADDTESYGTVIGIVSCACARRNLKTLRPRLPRPPQQLLLGKSLTSISDRIWAQPTAVWV